MKAIASDVGKTTRRVERQRLSPDAMKLLFRRNPTDLIKTLSKMLVRARAPETKQSVISEIDASGVSRFVIAVLGLKSSARQLGLDEDLVHRVRKANPELGANGFFRTKWDLDLRGLSNIEVPGLEEVGTSLLATSSSNILLPDLKRIGWDLWADQSDFLSAPNLLEIGQFLRAHDTNNLDLPSLRLAGGFIDLKNFDEKISSARNSTAKAHVVKNIEEAFPSLLSLGGEGLSLIGCNHISLPMLESIEGPVLVKSCQSLTFPTLRHVSGHLTVEVCRDLLMPVLASVGGDADLRLSPSTSLPSLKTVKGHALGHKENFPSLAEFT
jgi:hypothetical protein